MERQRLEADRVDFAAHVNSASKAAEVIVAALADMILRLAWPLSFPLDSHSIIILHT